MNRSTRVGFWLVVALQVMALLAFVGMREFTLRTGKEIVLQTVPVDPRDLFRGDYVRLRYDISTLSSRLTYCCTTGDTIYVVLFPDGEVWKAVASSRDIPSANVTFIRGRVTQDLRNPSRLEVEYGIEEYFVPEGTGREIERVRGGLKVKVVVDGFGTAAIRELILP